MQQIHRWTACFLIVNNKEPHSLNSFKSDVFLRNIEKRAKMRMAWPLVKSSVSTKKALSMLVFVAICLSFQGFGFIFFNHNRIFQDEKGNEILQIEKAKSLSYVTKFKSTRRSLKFFHIPKAAGTAIEHVAGEQMGIPWGSCLFNHKPKRDICNYPEDSIEWPRNYGWWHLPTQLFPMAGSNPYAGAELFAVIRDPFDRLVSEFYYTCKLRVFSWRPDQCDRSRLFDPEYMNEWLQNKLSKNDFSDAKTYLQDNGHFTPQYDFLVSKHEVRMVDYVLQMDELPQQFEKLMDAFSLDIRMARKKMNAARTSEKHLEPNDLDDKTVTAVQKVFSHDFEISPSYKRTPWTQTE